MIAKKFKNIIAAFILTILIFPTNALAYSSYIIPGGENIGIKITTKGIMIVGFYKVGTLSPGHDAGLKIGDKIIAVNNKSISSIQEMIDEINNDPTKDSITLTYERNGKTNQTNLNLIKDNNNIYKTGLYVKDSISGIGTLTYIDPETKIFGALGHEILEKETGLKIEVKDGKIFKSEVQSIQKSSNGNPGEKNATYFINDTYGLILKNTNSGIFGTYTSVLPTKKLYKVGEPNEVKLGSAKILTVLKSNIVEEFDINIIKLNTDQKNKNILFNITDQKLLEQTGGVVQGMSGSPIIQNNMIVGAVTHVVVEDATKGYGIFIKYMLEEAEN